MKTDHRGATEVKATGIEFDQDVDKHIVLVWPLGEQFRKKFSIYSDKMNLWCREYRLRSRGWWRLPHQLAKHNLTLKLLQLKV